MLNNRTCYAHSSFLWGLSSSWLASVTAATVQRRQIRERLPSETHAGPDAAGWHPSRASCSLVVLSRTHSCNCIASASNPSFHGAASSSMPLIYCTATGARSNCRPGGKKTASVGGDSSGLRISVAALPERSSR
jgi:hypothetical protein